MKRDSFKKEKFFKLTFISILLIVACTSKNSETITIRETVIVEQRVTVVITQSPTILEMPVTRIIEIPVTVTLTTPEEPTLTTTPFPTPTTRATSPPVYYEPHLYGDYTGISEIDYVAKAVLTRNVPALRELITFQLIPCIPHGELWGPYCNEDEPVGTVVEAFEFVYCEGFYTQAEDVITEVLDDFVARATGVYAIYGNRDYESYTIIFTSVYNNSGMRVLIRSGGKINSVFLGCGVSPAELSELLANTIEEIILRPVPTR